MNSEKAQEFVKVTKKDVGNYVRVQWDCVGVVDAILVNAAHDSDYVEALCLHDMETSTIYRSQIVHVGERIKPPHMTQ